MQGDTEDEGAAGSLDRNRGSFRGLENVFRFENYNLKLRLLKKRLLVIMTARPVHYLMSVYAA